MLEEVDITDFHRCCTCDRRDRRSSEGTLPRQTRENKYGLKSQTNCGPAGALVPGVHLAPGLPTYPIRPRLPMKQRGMTTARGWR